MKDFERKRKIRKTLYSRGVLLGLLLVLIVVSKATFSLYTKERESQKNLSLAEANLSTLSLREARLQSDIARLKTSEGIDAEIRSQFQVAKPGEKMVVLVDDKKNMQEEPTEKKSIVTKFFDLFR